MRLQCNSDSLKETKANHIREVQYIANLYYVISRMLHVLFRSALNIAFFSDVVVWDRFDRSRRQVQTFRYPSTTRETLTSQCPHDIPVALNGSKSRNELMDQSRLSPMSTRNVIKQPVCRKPAIDPALLLQLGMTFTNYFIDCKTKRIQDNIQKMYCPLPSNGFFPQPIAVRTLLPDIALASIEARSMNH